MTCIDHLELVRNTGRRAGFACAILAVAAGLLLFGAPSHSQEPFPAHRLRDHGLAAAGQLDWKEAFKDLDDAEKLAPQDPTILYDLGTVHAKFGDDVPAMFWLKAYLLAAPSASNVIQVVEEISARERVAREKEEKIYKTALNVAMQSKVSKYAFELLAEKEADAGHIQAALDIAQSQKVEDYDWIWMSDAEFAMLTDDFSRAQESLAHIKNIGHLVASRCDSSADVHRWDHISRQEAMAHFFACQFDLMGRESCPILDFRLVQEANDMISIPAIKAETMKNYQSLLASWEQSCVKTTPLLAWVACAENAEVRYGQMDLESDLSPGRLDDESFSDPERMPRVIAGFGSQIGIGIARFRSLEARVSQ